MADKIPAELRPLASEIDRLLRRLRADLRDHEACTRKLYGDAFGPKIHEAEVKSAEALAEAWTHTRAYVSVSITPLAEAKRALLKLRAEVVKRLSEMDAERLRCTRDYLQPKNAPLIQSAGDDDEWVGDDAKPMEIQTGLYFGNAVAYCPQTGHMAIEPLRNQAAKLARAGHIDGVSGELVDALESLHIGDDLILESDHVIGDDVIEVGRGKVAKKIKKVSKKVVKKVAKAGKAVAKSRLGKVIKTAVSMTNPAVAVSMKALSKGASVVKKSKSKPKTVAQAKSQEKAKTTVKLAEKKNKGRITPKQSKAAAKKNGIPHADIAQTSQALTVVDAAEAGDPTAQAALATHQQIETAQVAPLDPTQFSDEQSSSTSPDEYGEPEDESMPESDPQGGYFEPGSEAEETPDEAQDEEPGDESEDEAEE